MEKVIFKTDLCKGCGLCASACPKHIIHFSKTINAQGYNAAMVSDQDQCISCGSCAIICPDVVITVRKELLV